MQRMPQPKETFVADHARLLEFDRDPSGGIAGAKEQKSVSRRRHRSVELPGDPSAGGKDGEQEKCNQRAQASSVGPCSNVHQVARV